MRAQTLGDAKSAEDMRGRRSLEVNAEHPVVTALAARVAAGDADGGAKAGLELLYDAALITGGFPVESPKDFAGRIYAMVGAAVGGGEKKEE